MPLNNDSVWWLTTKKKRFQMCVDIRWYNIALGFAYSLDNNIPNMKNVHVCVHTREPFNILSALEYTHTHPLSWSRKSRDDAMLLAYNYKHYTCAIANASPHHSRPNIRRRASPIYGFISLCNNAARALQWNIFHPVDRTQSTHTWVGIYNSISCSSNQSARPAECGRERGALLYVLYL